MTATCIVMIVLVAHVLASSSVIDLNGIGRILSYIENYLDYISILSSRPKERLQRTSKKHRIEI